MAGSLKKVNQHSITSNTSSFYIGGITNASAVYVLTISNLKVDTNNTTVYIRVGTGGSAQASNYEWAYFTLYTGTAFINQAGQSKTEFLGLNALANGLANGYSANAVYYLHNWNNSAEYSMLTQEENTDLYTGAIYGQQGGGTHKVAAAYDEIHFVMSSGNMVSGEFRLYELLTI